ncbi:MAG: class I SAM-dependent methyltransferase [Planctomycetaceae bacterium]
MSTTCEPDVAALPIGSATMSPAMAHADRYARYLYDSVRPWLAAPVLEIGTGFGTYTGLLLNHGRVITADIDPVCLEEARRRYPSADLQTAVVDLNDRSIVARLSQYGANSIFCSNVLEHIDDDVAALSGLHDAIAPGGAICIIVPAHQRLYGFMDQAAGHFRRYTRRTLEWKLADSGWCVEKSFYVNALGGAGWWLNQRLLSPRPLDAPSINTQLAFYDRFVVPMARVVDPFFRDSFGLSVVAIARRTSR